MCESTSPLRHRDMPIFFFRTKNVFQRFIFVDYIILVFISCKLEPGSGRYYVDQERDWHRWQEAQLSKNQSPWGKNQKINKKLFDQPQNLFLFRFTFFFSLSSVSWRELAWSRTVCVSASSYNDFGLLTRTYLSKKRQRYTDFIRVTV